MERKRCAPRGHRAVNGLATTFLTKILAWDRRWTRSHCGFERQSGIWKKHATEQIGAMRPRSGPPKSPNCERWARPRRNVLERPVQQHWWGAGAQTPHEPTEGGGKKRRVCHNSIGGVKRVGRGCEPNGTKNTYRVSRNKLENHSEGQLHSAP